MSDWCILRTAGRSTLPLAKSLREAGYDVWTPMLKQRIRIPRMNARRIVIEPLLKGYVFAAYGHRYELSAIACGRSQHASFSLMLNEDDSIAGIKDKELEGLRWIEAKVNVTTRATYRTIPEGVSVRVSTGLFSGMTGVVRRSKRGLTLVCFNDRYSVEIPTSILLEDVQSKIQSATSGPTALAA